MDALRSDARCKPRCPAGPDLEISLDCAKREAQLLQDPDYDMRMPAHSRDPTALRHIGTVQSHGILMTLTSPGDGDAPRIRRVSDNLGALVGVPAASALGGPLASVLDPDSLLAVRAATASFQSQPLLLPGETPYPGAPGGIGGPVELQLRAVNGTEWNGTVHFTEAVPGGAPSECVLELEPPSFPGAFRESPAADMAIANLSVRSMRLAAEATSVEQLVQAIIRLFSEIVKVDRCMVYRFDPRKDGLVIAESLRDEKRSPLVGMSFPSMDIPPAARAMFLLNRFRSIPDATAPHAEVLSLPGEAPLDLGRSVLRSASPYHLQYMQNMGTRASLVNGIIVSGSLWGLFVCHNHYTPLYCNRRTRLACSNFVMMLATQIAWIQERLFRRAEMRARELHGAILESAHGQRSGLHQTFMRALFSADPSVQGLVKCCGVALVSAPDAERLQRAAKGGGSPDCDFEAAGRCPNRDVVVALAAFAERKCVERVALGHTEVWSTSYWSRDIPSVLAPPPPGICGVLAARLSPGSIVMYFREEMAVARKWACKEADLYNDDRHLNPRRSFELWVEYSKGQSEEFEEEDFAALFVLRSVWALNEKLGVSRQLKLVSQDLKQLTEAVTVPVITLCSESRLVHWNPKAEELLHLNRTPMLGRDFVDALVDDKNATDVRAAIRAASLASGASSLDPRGYEVEFSTRIVDETRPPLEILMRVFTRQDVAGQSGPFGVCCICTDLTESKSKMKAEIRAEETRKFLSTMSHEMRTPLNGVLGMLQLAKDYPLPPAATDYIDGAVRSGEHLLHLINDILDINRIEAGKLVLASTRFDVATIIRTAVLIVQPRATSKGIEIVVAMPEAVPEVYGDPERLQQILLNYISNGVKFTPDGGRIVIQTRVIDRRGRILDVRFDVIDNGVGIREKDQIQLFQRFYRVQDRSREDPGGTGLGLAICREIAERWGGKVGCETKHGEGSTFWVQLPLEVAGPEDPPRAASADQAARQKRREAARLSSQSETSSPVCLPLDTRSRSRSISAGFSGGVRHLLPALDLRRRLAPGSGPGSPGGSPCESPGPRSPSAGPPPLLADAPADAPIRPVPRNASPPAAAGGSGFRTPSSSERDGDAPLASSRSSATDRKATGPAWSPVCGSPHPDLDSPMDRGTPPLLSLRPSRVLVAEDNQTNVRIVRTMLEKAGHVVVVAADGEEAVDAFRKAAADVAGRDSIWAPPPTPPDQRPPPAQRAFDVILMDCEMPRKDGFSATREIRELEASFGLGRHPIVALTASVLPEDERRCYDAGMDHHVAKPVVRRLLLEAVDQFLDDLGAELALPPQGPLSAPGQAVGPPLEPAPSAGSGVLAEAFRSPKLSVLTEEMSAPKPSGAAARPSSAPPPPPRPETPPLRPPLRRALSGPSALESSLAVPPEAGPPLDLLVAEDNPVNMKVLTAMLEGVGWKVTKARDGQEAVEAFEGRLGATPPGSLLFSAILMDCQMPRMNGYQAAAKIREVERRLELPRHPIIAVTAYAANADDCARCLESGMDEYTTKPVKRDMLLQLVQDRAGAALLAARGRGLSRVPRP